MTYPIKPPETPPVDKLDEFGYEKVIPSEEKPPEVKVALPPKDPEIKDPATGYGKEPPPEMKEPVVSPAKIELGYELDLKDLAITEVTKLQEFAKTHALTKEVAQALVNLKKSELQVSAKALEDQQKQIIIDKDKTKASWDKELRTDPTFGGENFAPNVLKVERIMDDFMKDTKKELTKRGSMLPPYVMRDLSVLADKIYATEKLVQGDAGLSDAPKEKESSPLDFYV